MVKTAAEGMRVYLPLLIFVFSLAGCAGRSAEWKHAAAVAPSPKQGVESTLGEKVKHKISGEILADVNIAGRLKEVRRRGILRVALPPDALPFQSMFPELNQPVGFNVALAGAIADALETKPNVTILKKDKSGKWGIPVSRKEYFDIVFTAPGAGTCASGGIPYFYLGAGRGWLYMCAGSGDPAMKQAVENALDYFNESGIFASLYSSYFK